VRASVVIPSHNRPDLVVRTVRSAVSQTVPRSVFEVLVVDDGSTPPVTEAFRGGRLPEGVRILRSEENVGRAAARNLGIRAARGEVVIMLDDDIEVVPGLVAAHLEVHASNPRAVALGKILVARELGRDPYHRYLDTRGVEKVRPGDVIPSRYFVTGNSSVPKAGMDEVGLFDESFSLYGGEDTDLGLRLGKAGYEFRYAGDAVGYHLDVVDIDRTCRRLAAYGREALPRVVARHPELKTELALDILDPPRWGREAAVRSLRRALFQASLRPRVFRLARGLARMGFLGKALFPVYDYLRAYSYMTGYAEAVRGEDR